MTTSTAPPTLDNPRGVEVVEATIATSVLMVIIVGLRLWGRYRYSDGPGAMKLNFGDHRFWVVLSDLTILLSLVVAIVLAVIACYAVKWGLGLHTAALSGVETKKVLEMFFLYQIFYKFAAGISKIATCLLLLAISTPQMARFNLCCQIMILYIAGVSLSCSIATVFQCGLDIESNWIHTNRQTNCFPKPPFWYTHAALNIISSVVIAILPWWLFHYVTYSRKYIIATLMTMLAIAELVFGCVRLDGLYISSHSLSDLTYGATTGILVSQLEVNFGIISACIPTVLKIAEECFRRLFSIVTGQKITTKSQSRTLVSNEVPLSTMDQKQSRSKYARFGEDEENDLDSTHSDYSRKEIIPKTEERNIMVQTSFVVENDPSSLHKMDQSNNIHGQFVGRAVASSR